MRIALLALGDLGGGDMNGDQTVSQAEKSSAPVNGW
jgi:hypothetical protein